MIRKLLLPLAATALLAGCVAVPYGYRADDHGDYYYGSPSVEYRYHDAWPYYGFGYPGYYGPYRSGFSFYGYYGGGYPGYGYPGYGYYGYPRYGYPYRYTYPSYHPHNGDPHNGGHPGNVNRPDGGPWRNPDEIVRRRRSTDGGGGGMVQVEPRPSMPVVTRPEGGGVGPRAGGERDGSAAGDVIRRARRESGAGNEP
ncbi:hypothetical protein [Lysobacter claricitrinus]|uniref:hypothetical protein n=1 Tax=Lysobacter claricitrinus TaxID=3367728 RepID=UPI0037DB49A2